MACNLLSVANTEDTPGTCQVPGGSYSTELQSDCSVPVPGSHWCKPRGIIVEVKSELVRVGLRLYLGRVLFFPTQSCFFSYHYMFK